LAKGNQKLLPKQTYDKGSNSIFSLYHLKKQKCPTCPKFTILSKLMEIAA